jgi:hypothetical protein
MQQYNWNDSSMDAQETTVFGSNQYTRTQNGQILINKHMSSVKEMIDVVNSHTVRFDPTTHSFKCTCLAKDWCIHRESYFRAGHDRDYLMSVASVKRVSIIPVKYTIMHGYVTVPIEVEVFSEKEILDNGNGDSKMHRLSFQDHYLWMDELTSGWDLIKMVLAEVRLTSTFKKWTSWGLMGMIPKGQKCKNRHHDNGDNQVFNSMCKDLAQEPLVFTDYILANAFYDEYYGRCLSCFEVLNKLNDDIPSMP